MPVINPPELPMPTPAETPPMPSPVEIPAPPAEPVAAAPIAPIMLGEDATASLPRKRGWWRAPGN